MTGADSVDRLRGAGFSEVEVKEWVAGQRRTLTTAGFDDTEVAAHFGIKPFDEVPVVQWAQGVFDRVSASFDAEDETGPTTLELLEKGVVEGFQSSVTGMLIRQGLPDVQVGADAPLVERLAAQFSGVVSDFPVFIGGAVVGAAVGTSFAPGPGTIAGAGGGAFGLQAALRESLVLGYRDGAIDDFEEFAVRVGAVFVEMMKGVATGASTTTAGSLASGPLTRFGAELTTMVTVQKALEGEVPSAQDFLEGAVVLMGLKGAIQVAGKGVTVAQKQTKQAVQVVHDIYATTGKRPADILADLQNDPTILNDVLAMLDPKTIGQIPRAYERLAGSVEPPPLPTPPKPVNTSISPAQQAIRDRISVGEKDAPPTFRDRLDNLYTEGFDSLYPLSRLVDKLREGEVLPANVNPYKAATFMPAASAKAQMFLDFEVRRFNSTEVTSRSLKDILEPVQKDLDGIREYAVAKRTIELEARGVKTGVPLDKAKAFVKQGVKKYQSIFEEMGSYQTAVTEYLKDSGVISPETFAKIQEANKDYVPFFRLFEPSETPGLGKGTKVRDPIKKIKGSERRIVDPLESIIKNVYLYTALADRNTVNVRLVELAERKGGTGAGALVEKIAQPKVPTTLSKSEMKKIADQVKKEFGIEFTPEELTVFRARSLQPSDTQIAVFRNGKREVFEVGEDVGRALNGLDGGSANALVKLLSAPAKTLRAGAILNPEFFAKNLTRDTITATVFSNVGFRPFVDTMLGGLSLIKKDTAFRDWMMSGGANASIVSLDRLYLQQSLERLTKDTGLMTRATNVIKSPLEILRVGAELAENATRLGAFKRATRGDRTPEAIAKGAVESRESTQDFNRMGASIRGYNQISAFLAARIGGYDRIVRGFKDNPVRAITMATATITMPSIALWFANHSDPRWKEIPQWQKDMFWIVMGDNTVYRIPKPFELGVLFGTLPEHLLEAFVADNPKALPGLVKAFASNSLSSVFPTFATPIVESAANFSFFREAPLVPARVENQLTEYQYTEYTSELAKKIGLISGSIGISPIGVENFVRQWSGGLGTYAMQLADFGLRKTGVLPDPPRPSDTLADIPFVKAFVIRHPSAGGQVLIDFYNNFNERERISNTTDALIREGRFDEAEKVRALDPGAAVSLSGMRSALTDLSTLTRNIFSNPDIPRDEKRQIIDQTYRIMSDIALNGNLLMDSLKGPDE